MAHRNVTGSPETDPSTEDKGASRRDEVGLSLTGKEQLLTAGRKVRRPHLTHGPRGPAPGMPGTPMEERGNVNPATHGLSWGISWLHTNSPL